MSQLRIQAYVVRPREGSDSVNLQLVSVRGSIGGEGIELRCDITDSWQSSAIEGIRNLAGLLGSGAAYNSPPKVGEEQINFAFSYQPPYNTLFEKGLVGTTFPLSENQQLQFEHEFLREYKAALQQGKPSTGATHV